MFQWKDESNLVIDCELFTNYIQQVEKSPRLTTDDLHYVILAMIGTIAISNPYSPCTYTTLDGIIATMVQDVNFKVKPRVRAGLMKGLNALYAYGNGAIHLSERFTEDKKQVVCINGTHLVHTRLTHSEKTRLKDLKNRSKLPFTDRRALTNEEKEELENLEYWSKVKFFTISRKELATIMTSSVPHHLITLMCNYCSRFSGNAYEQFSKDAKYWHPQASCFGMNLQIYKKLSCWASQDTLTMSWINFEGEEVPRKNKWEVEQSQFSRWCKQLVDLGVLDRHVVGFTGGRISYYFRPIHKDIFLWTIELLGKQQAYVVEQEEKETKDDDLDKILAKCSGTVDYD